MSGMVSPLAGRLASWRSSERLVLAGALGHKVRRLESPGWPQNPFHDHVGVGTESVRDHTRVDHRQRVRAVTRYKANGGARRVLLNRLRYDLPLHSHPLASQGVSVGRE